MEGLKLGGHPLHPALVHFPVACWTAAPALDALYLVWGNPACWQASFWCIAVGVGMGVLAMTAGLMDLVALPAEHPAQDTAQRHMLLVGSAWCVFAVSLLFRPLHGTPTDAQAWLALGLSAGGWLLLGLGAYAGARLVYDFGLGQTRKT
ncbi:MAG: DUF2231 domain-containing protein [Bacillota bacterium]